MKKLLLIISVFAFYIGPYLILGGIDEKNDTSIMTTGIVLTALGLLLSIALIKNLVDDCEGDFVHHFLFIAGIIFMVLSLIVRVYLGEVAYDYYEGVMENISTIDFIGVKILPLFMLLLGYGGAISIKHFDLFR